MQKNTIPKPNWLKIRPPAGENYGAIKKRLRGLNLYTVCEEAKCPNLSECWAGGTATIMIMGDTCTRACRFCHVKSGHPNGWLDLKEPTKVGQAVAEMALTYVVLTSVDRDDLPDGGASHFGATIKQVKKYSPKTFTEVLIPDFGGDEVALRVLLQSEPDVLAHNVETVSSLSRQVRDRRAGYYQSLELLERAKVINRKVYTKSSIMLGLGETEEQLYECMRDLRRVNCDVLTLGQYLQPSAKHLPVKKYVSPEEFAVYKKVAEDMGFLYVASGPLVRSSYKAGEMFMEGYLRQQRGET